MHYYAIYLRISYWQHWLLAGTINWVVSMVDAYSSAQRINLERAYPTRRLSLQPRLSEHQEGALVSFRL